MSIPKDPYILLSFINTKLRDYYPNLDILCNEQEINRVQLEKSLSSIGYAYVKDQNQFISIQ